MLIDTHTHATAGWTRETVEKCFQVTGVDKVILAAVPIDHWGVALTESCAKLIEQFPGKAVGLIGIHPPDVDQSLRDIDAYHAKGFVGVKLMPTTGYHPDDEKHRRVFEEINARKMIVLTHCGWCSRGIKERDLPQSTKFAHPHHFEPLLRIFPDTDFIFAHAGGRTTWEAAFDLVHYHDNAWLDTCPGNGTWIFQNAPLHWLRHLSWDRVLFGSDMAYGAPELAEVFTQKAAFIRRLLHVRGFADRVDDVMGKNAARLLRQHGVKAVGN